MIVIYALVMLLGGTAFGMEKEGLTKEDKRIIGYIIKDQDKLNQCQCIFEHAVPKIRDLRNQKKNKRWDTILNSKSLTKELLDYVHNSFPQAFIRDNDLDDIDWEGAYLRKDSAAMVLGTPGAIALAKDCIKENPQKKEEFQSLMFHLVSLGNKGMRENNLSWDEDVDVVKVGLEVMGKEGLVKINQFDGQNHLLVDAADHDNLPVAKLLLELEYVDTEVLSIQNNLYIRVINENGELGIKRMEEHVHKRTALYETVPKLVSEAYLDMADLLILHGANVDFADCWGRTTLIIAAMEGYPKMVEQLIHAGATVYLSDCFEKTALCYAKKRLAGIDKNLLNLTDEQQKSKKWCAQNDQEKRYETIVRLLEAELI